MSLELNLQPLTQQAFAEFGQVIESGTDNNGERANQPMNDARFVRYDALATTEVCPDSQASISVAQCLQPTQLPYPIELLERHPLGSQAFIPLQEQQMIIVVAKTTSTPGPADLRGFISNGQQGIQYHRGIWHMPLIAFQAGARFLIVDSNDKRPNCEEITLSEPVWLPASALQAISQAVNKP